MGLKTDGELSVGYIIGLKIDRKLSVGYITGLKTDRELSVGYITGLRIDRKLSVCYIIDLKTDRELPVGYSRGLRAVSCPLVPERKGLARSGCGGVRRDPECKGMREEGPGAGEGVAARRRQARGHSGAGVIT